MVRSDLNMKPENRFANFKLALISIMISFLALGQADGGLVGILTPYIVAITVLTLIVLPLEVLVRIVFNASIIDLVR